MSCYHPLLAYPDGSLTKNMKPHYRIISREQYNALHRNDKLTDHISNYNDNAIEIPCGKCIGCKLDYSRSWADRCMLELQYHKSNYFITLTYNDDNLRYKNIDKKIKLKDKKIVIPEIQALAASQKPPFSTTSEKPYVAVANEVERQLKRMPTLLKKDLSQFMKSLRHHFPNQRIRFYGCGEYGSQNFRPHYHIIIFGLELDDLVFLKKSSNGDNYYYSKTLEDIWHKGFVCVADVTWETCAYTARYVTKKLFGSSAKVYDEYNIEPEFCLMSRNPGIARQYYEDHKQSIYSTDGIHISTNKGGRTIKSPRYYDKLYDVDNPEDFKRIKDIKTEIMIQNLKLKSSGSSLNYVTQLQVDERCKSSKIKSLERSKV